jgi:hypothetical protein
MLVVKAEQDQPALRKPDDARAIDTDRAPEPVHVRPVQAHQVHIADFCLLYGGSPGILSFTVSSRR